MPLIHFIHLAASFLLRAAETSDLTVHGVSKPFLVHGYELAKKNICRHYAKDQPDKTKAVSAPK